MHIYACVWGHSFKWNWYLTVYIVFYHMKLKAKMSALVYTLPSGSAVVCHF